MGSPFWIEAPNATLFTDVTKFQCADIFSFSGNPSIEVYSDASPTSKKVTLNRKDICVNGFGKCPSEDWASGLVTVTERKVGFLKIEEYHGFFSLGENPLKGPPKVLGWIPVRNERGEITLWSDCPSGG